MSDLPQRASASQMAARSFSKRPTGRRKPLTTPSASPQPQQQSFPSLSQNNNLFGKIGGSGDFSFSAGGPSLSFSSPQPSFGGFNINNTNSNPPANNHANPQPTFSFGSTTSDNSNNSFTGDDREESMGKRKAKGLLHDGGVTSTVNGDDDVPQFAIVPPEIEHGFAASTGVPQAPPSTVPQSAFTFGSSGGTGLFGASSSAPLFNPFAPATAPAADSQNKNIFGASTSAQNNPFAPAASTGIQGSVFGGASTSRPSTPSNLFAPVAPVAGPTNAFGAPSTSNPTSSNSNNIFAPKAAAGSQGNIFGGFGQPAAQASQSQASQPESAQPAKSSLLFGSSTPAQPAAVQFGSTAQSTQASSAPGFGATPATSSAPTSNMFGTVQQQQEQKPSELSTPAETPGLFQTAPVQAPSTSNLFGSEPQSGASSTSTLFGTPQPAASSSTGSLFGSVTQAPTQQSTGLFNTPQSQPTPASGLSTNLGGSLFNRVETPENTAPAATTPTAAAATGLSLFDRTANAADSGNVQGPTPSTTINPTINGDSVFGQVQPAPPTNEPPTESRSIFERISRDSDGNPIRVLPESSSASLTQSSNSLSVFGQVQPAPSTNEPPTESRSIFERISRDSDGNPIRVLPESSGASLTQPSNSLSNLNQPMPQQSDNVQPNDDDLDPQPVDVDLDPQVRPTSEKFARLSISDPESVVNFSAISSFANGQLFQPQPSQRLCQCLRVSEFEAALTETLESGDLAQYFVSSTHPAVRDENLHIIERAVHEPSFLQMLEESLEAGLFEHFDQFVSQAVSQAVQSPQIIPHFNQYPQVNLQPAQIFHQQTKPLESNHITTQPFQQSLNPYAGPTMFADLAAPPKPAKPLAIPLGPATPLHGQPFGGKSPLPNLMWSILIYSSVKRPPKTPKPTNYPHHIGTTMGVGLQLLYNQQNGLLPFTKTHKVVATHAPMMSKHDILLEIASYPPCLREVLESSQDSFTEAAQQLLTEAKETQKWPAPSLVKKDEILTELVKKIKANSNPKGTSTSHQPHTPPPGPAAEIPEEFMDPLIPAHFTSEQRLDFYVAYRIRALNIALQKQCSTIPAGSITAAVAYYNEQREKILAARGKPYKSSKRKAVLEEQDLASSKRSRETPPSNQAAPAGPSNTTRSTPAVSATTSAATLGPSTLNGTAAPLFGASPAASPTKNKRKAEYQISDRDPDGSVEEQRRFKMPKTNGNTSSETSNIFKTIVDSPKSTPSPTKKVHSLEFTGKTTDSQTPRANPFATIQVPGASSKSVPSPSTNIFSSKAAESVPSPARSASPAATTAVAQPIKPPTFGVKPPTFGSGPVNFLAQFGQQAKKDEKDNEEKLMEKAKEEDMDSDDDEAEWEAKYKEKRKAELKELEELAKSKHASFVVGKGFTFGDTSKTADATSTTSTSLGAPAKSIFTTSTAGASTSLFSQTPPPSSGGSIFGSANGSRASTPGGSVLDSHAPGKAATFSSNIFGHLSGPNSPANGQDNDSDDESDHHGESDSENKDPTYQPPAQGSEAGSGPTTPVEKTGAGIASAKKATSNLFNFGTQSTGTTQVAKPLFGQSTSSSGGMFGAPSGTGSGTSTPSGGLFDRISKDSNGNPIRQLPAEEKENTQPNTTNIFGGSNSLFGKSTSSTNGTINTSDTPASTSIFGQTDKTWKPDSPIRFGSATQNGASTTMPTVNVTDASPTKSNVFGGLFGSNAASKAAAPTNGGLFGSATPSLAPSAGAVGWSFGGPSSTASSLLPSAATSRATSPGQTTDGDSAAEGGNDPDAEHHEQIDLTKGGPGEEHEDCIYEVRAKALKFTPSDAGNPWSTKGLGPLRVLKHKENNATRVLLRADPSGTIVLNKGILAGVEYAANGKTLKFLCTSDSGSGLETWMLQVKTPESATALAQVLESNKSSS
ncbi:hypothetical protein BP6252_03114 [Coleophoma cylindrospora]|uniref:RanBD1 domain-containing protein n=1 Tax=Coleophoma cylindrospora TaxID=1849047 RepID=A0A3D8S6T5_9HELO|nr:hypothetical protein BP6252_03114 [Coleophoma cylindrospora]